MPHHVYANDNEIASKSSDGKSVAAFPDVCFSPPTPPSSGVPIPYANSCFARDISNGSKTVLVGGAEVALENHSYFAQSVGDESATPALKKGMRSKNIRGKCFFQTWSQNVKIEGMGVTRHMDLVTHNHTNAGNTPPNTFLSRAEMDRACKDELRKVENNCKANASEEQRKQKSMLRKILGPQKYQALEKVLNANNRNQGNWISDYCEGMMIKPISTSNESLTQDTKAKVQEFQKKVGDISNDLKNNSQKVLDDALESLSKEIKKNAGDKVSDMALDKVKNAGVRHGAGLVASVFPPAEAVVQVGLGVWTLVDGMVGVGRAAATLIGAYAELAVTKGVITAATSQLGEIAADAKNNPQRAMANLMTVLAKMNGCLRARRCFLVSYEDTESPRNLQGNGCCPGQTGHHLLPGEMFYDRTDCNTYARGSEQHKKAPTICVEGTSNDFKMGSHGKMHEALDKDIKKYKEPGVLKFGDRNLISYDDAKAYAIGNVQQVFPESSCGKKCLEKQLDSYYTKKILCDPEKKLLAKSGAMSTQVQNIIEHNQQKVGQSPSSPR